MAPFLFVYATKSAVKPLVGNLDLFLIDVGFCFDRRVQGLAVALPTRVCLDLKRLSALAYDGTPMKPFSVIRLVHICAPSRAAGPVSCHTGRSQIRPKLAVQSFRQFATV